jgi:type II secretory pathway component PulF
MKTFLSIFSPFCLLSWAIFVDLETVQLGTDAQLMGDVLPLLGFRLFGRLVFAALCIVLIRRWNQQRLPFPFILMILVLGVFFTFLSLLLPPFTPILTSLPQDILTLLARLLGLTQLAGAVLLLGSLVQLMNGRAK